MRFVLRTWMWVAVFFAPASYAVTPVFDINVFYFSDTFTYNDAPSVYKRTFYDIMVGFGLTKKKSLVLGWNYDSMTFSDNPGTEVSLKITDMGPKILYYIDKERTWVIGFTYNLITKGTYNAGGAAAETELRGRAMKAEFGYLPMMWENVYIGAKLNYYKATFNEEITNETTLDQVSNSRTAIYPSFSMTIRWD